MAKARQRAEIIGSILDAANGGVMKNKLRYMAKLNDANIKEYIAYLVEGGLLKYDKCFGKQILKTTPKGLRILYLYSQLLTQIGTTM
jgi:predicted transcriptional regulator